MKYTKRPFTKLHHTETHRLDDGSYEVQAHVMHHPPVPDGKKVEHMVAPSSDYPNKTIRHSADDLEEASEIHGQMLAAHQHEGGRRGAKSAGEDAEEEHAEQKESYS